MWKFNTVRIYLSTPHTFANWRKSVPFNENKKRTFPSPAFGSGRSGGRFRGFRRFNDQEDRCTKSL